MSAELVTVVLPCFNESTTLRQSLATLIEWFSGRAIEILVVDDGSTDGTYDIARQFAVEHSAVRLLRAEVNGGKGAAISRAARHVSGSAVVILDADLSYGLKSVLGALDGLHDADVVIGNRRDLSSTYQVPVHLFGFLYRRHLIGITFNGSVRALLPLKFKDTQCGLKAFRSDAFVRIGRLLQTTRFAFDVEMLLIAHGLGLRITEVPVHVTYESSRSSVQLARDGTLMARDLFRLAWRRARGEYTQSSLSGRLERLAVQEPRQASTAPPVR